MHAIHTQGLTRVYGSRAVVKELDLAVEEGEFFGLLGVNGAGKTTVIKMLSCLLAPTAGDALLGGHSIRSSSAAVKAITNVSPQETAIAPNLTVEENLTFLAGIYGMAAAKAREAAQEVIRELDLTRVSHSRAGTLSGGWQRRLSIAMALISRPRILFLDEPTLGLDVLARRELWDVLRGLKGKATVVLTTHYLEEAEALCDRIAIMAEGRLCRVGTAAELKQAAGKSTFEEAFVAIATGEV